MGYKIKRIMVGDKQVRPYKTFTIQRTEKSDMSSGWTYSDDAAGLTAGSSAFDEFFGYSAVLLNTSGTEVAEVTQESSGGAGKLNFSSLGTLTNTSNNVMVKFPMRGIKMSKSGSVVTLSITSEPNKTGYQYYAFTKGGAIKNNMYLGAFLSTLTNGTAASSSGTIAKSWATKSRTADVSPMANKNISVCNTYSSNNGTGYSQMAFFQRMYVNALYMMKYGNPNTQNVIGAGYTGGSQSVAPGNTVSYSTNATYGTSSTTVQCKLFGLEDRWGNINQWADGFYIYNRTIYVATDNSSFYNTSIPSSAPSNYIASGASYSSNIDGDISSIWGSNTSMFIPESTVYNYNYDTYYGDYFNFNNSGFGGFGGRYGFGLPSGAFRLYINESATAAYATCGSRLMYL